MTNWSTEAAGFGYVARVRVKVRAGDREICREGCGSGQGRGNTRGEAHESRVRSPKTVQRLAERARIVLLAAEGRSTRAIAKALGIWARPGEPLAHPVSERLRRYPNKEHGA